MTGGDKAGPMKFESQTMKAFVVDFRPGVSHAAVSQVSCVDAAPLLNGMAGVPENPHIMLSLDSN